MRLSKSTFIAAVISGSFLVVVPTLALAKENSRKSSGTEAKPSDICNLCGFGDGDTGGGTIGGGGIDGGGAIGGGGGFGGRTCYNYAGPVASCEAMALGFFYPSCSGESCH